MKPLTLLGFDFGMSHIGYAVGQTLTHSATPLGCLKAKKGMPDWHLLIDLVRNWQPKLLIVGMPLDMCDNPSVIAPFVLRFAKQLKQHTHLPVQFIDEKLSSWAACDKMGVNYRNKSPDRCLATKAIIDANSAKIIVETWLTEYLNGKRSF